jgi:ABC-type glycerol-3-phosphate transport system substrate-binding protein
MRARAQRAVGVVRPEAAPASAARGVRTRRRLLPIATGALGLGAALGACAPAGSGQTGPVASRAPVTVEYWTFWNDERLAFVRPELPKLEAQTGYVRATLTPDATLRDKLRTVLAAGTPPDASIADVFSAALYFDNGSILDLKPALTRDKVNLRRDWVLTGYEDWCGKNFVFPLTGWSYAIAYNKDLFRKAGLPDPWAQKNGTWTWDDLTEYATRLTAGKDADGLPEVFGFLVDGHSVYRGYHPFIVANGGEVFDYGAMRYTLDHPKTIEALEWLAEQHKRRVFRPAAYKQPFEGDAFNLGKLGLVGDPNYRSRPGVMKDLAFEWDLIMYPSRTAGGPQFGNAGGDHNWVLKGGKNPDAAYELIKFMGMDEVQGALGRERPVQPAKQSVRHDKEGFLKSPPAHMPVFNDIWDKGYYRAPFIFQYNDLETQRKIDELVVPAVADGAGSVRDACLEANRQANQLVKYGERCFKAPWKPR